MKKRIAWMDAMRLVCAFLVIVNHTNSELFMHTTPQNGTWWLSLLWYYLCKPAVPVFVIISGACLLRREDGYRRCALRAARMLLLLVIASALYDLFRNGSLSLERMYRAQACDSLWYLFLYIGLMLMLPLLQKLRLSRKDTLYLIALCFLFGTALPLAAHYVPALEPVSYFHIPLFSVWIGLFFTGSLIREDAPVTGRTMLAALAVLVLSLACSVLLTYAEYQTGAAKYWFMDDRMAPSPFTVIAALALITLCRGLCRGRVSSPALAALSGCTLGIYLLQETAIDLTRAPVYLPLCSRLPGMAAMVVWELVVFAGCLIIAYVLRLIPGMKKIL